MKSIYIFILASLSAASLFATHNKSGEIQYRQIGEKTIQCYIITYTDPISVPADRDSLEVNWGDGMTEWVVRTNGNGDGELISNRFQHNIYVSTHTYKSFGEYTLSIDDSNRNDGILNINNGNSNIFSFYVFNTFTLDAEYKHSEISSYSIDIRSLIQGTYFLLLDNKYVAQFCKI